MRAATLAVGTELTDGQIIDRNSAWISERLVSAGVSVVEHRAVADDRSDIERALRELASRVDLLFVTGGLGPTSDDITRDLIAKVAEQPLEFHDESWSHLRAQLEARGIKARDIQKQQCFFPVGARILKNPAGTANAFEVPLPSGTKLYALPGPPLEIAAVWEVGLASEIESLVPIEERDELRIYRCLGRGESQVAEVVEELIKDSVLRVGYRANLPYIEVKLWYARADAEKATRALEAVESALREWIVNRDDEDAIDAIVGRASRAPIRIVDGATGGVLQERLNQRLRDRRLLDVVTDTKVETILGADVESKSAFAPEALGIRLYANAISNSWRVTIQFPGQKALVLEERPPFQYKVLSDRGRKYITEKTFVLVTQHEPK